MGFFSSGDVSTSISFGHSHIARAVADLKEKFEFIYKMLTHRDEGHYHPSRFALILYRLIEQREEYFPFHFSLRQTLSFLTERGYIGYINYDLLQVLSKQHHPLLHFDWYEHEYRSFLEMGLEDPLLFLKECPDLQRSYPIGLPKFTIHLKSKWNGRSVYEWKELLEKQHSWPEKFEVLRIKQDGISYYLEYPFQSQIKSFTTRKSITTLFQCSA